MKKIFFAVVLLTQLTAFSQQRDYKVIAYSMGDVETMKQYPLQKLTHIIYSFLHLRNDSLTWSDDKQRNTLVQLGELKKQYPNLKIMVSLGGWGGCEPCSEIFSTEEHRNTFAKTTVELLKEFNLDGLDLDWEYPTIEGYPGHNYSSNDKQNFTELVKALRKEMGKDYLLAFAAGGFSDYLEKSVDWEAVMPEVDFVNLMTYDLVSGFSKVTGHHTPLKGYRPNQQSTENCVNWLLQHGVKSEQLIIGAAFYARVWEQVQPDNNGLYNAGSFKHGVPYKNFETYFSDTSGFRYYWDKKARAPYRYNESKQLFATFDDERSIKAKTKFIRRKKLGGIMFWELREDKKTEGLVDVISNHL
ncbi:MAG: glycoside hydrolase family 18 protein [Ferruginibacter sp.]